MTKYYQDIVKQPEQLQQSLSYSFSEGSGNLSAAAKLIGSSSHVYISGIGASWCAAVALHNAFQENGFPVMLTDAAELLHHSIIPSNSVVILLSRSGKSIEVVQLLNKFHVANAKVIAITNNLDSVLATDADVALFTAVDFDHSISVNTYSSIVLTGLLLVIAVKNQLLLKDYYPLLSKLLNDTEGKIKVWQNLLTSSNWMNEKGHCYFLGRGASLSSAYESMLLWHEVVKQPASALSTGFFRHGPQEIINNPLNMVLWLQNDKTRLNDIQLINDLNNKGVNFLIIGEDIPHLLPGLHIELPQIISTFSGVVDIIPMQLAASILADKIGADPDNFLYCNFIVEKEGGL
jgi:glutamine---fructose-6-phosphate transaminase (isomerizing)